MSITRDSSGPPPLDKHSPLVVQDLNKRYKNGTWANRSINFTANPSEILGILGPNGAGKTTLVHQITTELIPTSGEIRVLGHDVVSEPLAVKRLLGVMPQDALLFDYLTVYQHLRIFAKLRGFTPRESAVRAGELIKDLDLADYRNVTISKLSGGLRRRILVGIAVAARPPVMILDEPTTGLDPRSRRSLWAVLRRHQEQGAFVLLSTQNMEEAEYLCDRVGIIRAGRLLALDTVDNLRSSYGFAFKITYAGNDTGGERLTQYGSNEQELVSSVREMGIHNFSVAPTNLEDIYLALTGDRDGFDDWSI